MHQSADRPDDAVAAAVDDVRSGARFPWLLAGALYLLAHGISLLFLDALYWDDWTVAGFRPEVLVDTFRQAGWMLEWPGHMHNLLLPIGPAAYRVLTLVLMFLPGVFLWSLLGTVRSMTTSERTAVVLLFLLLPLNSARVAIAVLHYTICYFAFFLGWYLFVMKRGVLAQGAALACFVVSFTTNSFLAFYALPIAHKAFIQAGWEIPRLVSWARRHVLFLLAPFIFFFVKTQYFRPYGFFEGYNRLSIKGLAAAIGLAVVAVALIFAGVRAARRKPLATDARAIWMLCLGLAATWLAVFPYLAVLHTVSFADWESRNQMLMPLGISLVVAGASAWVSHGRMRRAIALAVAGCVAATAYTNYEYLMDWKKQQAVISLLGQSERLRQAKTILFHDATGDEYARDRTIRYYEYNAWLKAAFHDESRYAVDLEDWPGQLCQPLPAFYTTYISEYYNSADYQRGTPDVLVRVLPADRSRFARWLPVEQAKVSLEVVDLHCGRGDGI